MTTTRQHEYIVTLSKDALILAKSHLAFIQKYNKDDKEKIKSAADKVKERKKALTKAEKDLKDHLKRAQKRKK